jgi:hypothetical protein
MVIINEFFALEVQFGHAISHIIFLRNLRRSQ